MSSEIHWFLTSALEEIHNEPLILAEKIEQTAPCDRKQMADHIKDFFLKSVTAALKAYDSAFQAFHSSVFTVQPSLDFHLAEVNGVNILDLNPFPFIPVQNATDGNQDQG